MFINSMGHYVPSTRVHNDYFFNINGLTSDWILQRTGILTRSKAGEGEGHNSMGMNAIADAVEKLPYDVKDVDLIVSASYSPYDTVATLAHIAQREYGMDKAKAVYASAACSSFVNGLEIIEGYFAMGKATKALIVCSEHNTYYSNESDPKCGHLWGDAAVAFFISKEKQAHTDHEILSVYTHGLGHVGKGPAGVCLRPKEDGISMPEGRDVFMNACHYMIDALNNAAESCNMTLKDIEYIICHQANKRIVKQVSHQLDMPDEKFLNNIEELGNTGSASSALVLSQNQNELPANSVIGLTVFGGGYSCGAFMVRM